MNGELRLQAKRLLTNVAFVRFIFHVDPAVVLQGRDGAEGSVAHGTSERAASRVPSNVTLESKGGDESLPAVWTVVDVLVNFKVLLQLLQRLKLHPADATNVVLLVHVSPGVDNQTPQLPVPGATHLTGQLTPTVGFPFPARPFGAPQFTSRLPVVTLVLRLLSLVAGVHRDLTFFLLYLQVLLVRL